VSGPEVEREAGLPAVGRLVSTGGLLADLVVGVDAVPGRGEDALARDFTQTVGGSFAVMSAAARLGLPVALAGVLGDDAIGDAGRAALAAEWIELLLPEPRPGSSGVCLVMVDAEGERTMVTVEGVESRLSAEDLATIALRPDDAVYVSGYDLVYPHGPALAAWLERTEPRTVIFDPGPLIAQIPPALLTSVLHRTTWLTLNTPESTHLEVDGPITQELLELSAHQHGGVVVRRGVGGCEVLGPRSEPVVVAAFPTEVVDTTGAGDTHTGAFVAALARGLGPVEAARWGNAAASFVISSRGQVSPPRLDQLRAILDSAG
jgi:ribokinase